MSNGIRYDPLLVRYLAVELDRRLADRPVRAVRLDRDRRRASLAFDDATLVWDLHPERGWVRLIAGGGEAPDSMPLHRRATVGRVEAPDDERLLSFIIDSPGRSVRQARRVVVELMTNQWNALVLSREDRILAVLRSRETGGRALRTGRAYSPPTPRTRARPEDAAAWRSLLADAPPRERSGVYVRRVAYASSLNAAPVLGAAAGEGGDRDELDAAFERWASLVAFPPLDPVVLTLDDRRQPYPLPLPDTDAEAAPSLLDAMDRVAEAADAEEPAAAVAAIPLELLDRLREAVRRLEGRERGLSEELVGARPEAEALRHRANLLLSQLHRVDKGMDEIELPDLEGGTVTIELDPALAPHENADRFYEEAQKRERAAERLPGLIEETKRERRTLEALLERAERGEADAAEIEKAIGPPPGEDGKGAREPESLAPYRSYRTSGGLEVRVGRNRQANDDLTFHHSHPEDVWMHARQVAGSHVILRWGRTDGNPPRRDLLEAAVLAALNSKARTSGTVAVDWTRRKYVRKPRKAPPGRVVPDRVQTVFVEPDESVERRLRAT